MTAARESFHPFDLLTTRRAQIAIICASTIVVAIMTAAHIAGNLIEQGAAFTYWSLLAAELVQWGLWAAFIPIIARVEQRVGVGALGWVRGIGAHLLAALVLALVANAIMAPIIAILGLSDEREVVALMVARAPRKLPESFGVYALIAGVLWLVGLARERAAQARRASLLANELTAAKLSTLQAQLQPHFLFNTLNLVAGLVRHSRSDVAVETIADLADLLRRSLRNMDRQTITLAEELDWVRRYLSIQKRRFGDLLRVEEQIGDGALAAEVPAFLLQPLVENAVMHGLRLAGGGNIWLAASIVGAELRVTVEDDGVGVSSHPTEGLGLRVTRDRLATQYGGKASLHLKSGRAGGTAVMITLPFEARG